MSISHRPAKIEDLPYIVNVYNTIVEGGEVTADLSPATAEAWTPWFHKHNDTTRPLWILEYEGKTCGWLSFKDYHPRPAYSISAEVSLYLHPDFRGKGLGYKFLLTGLEHVRQAGVKNVLALVFASNRQSTKLFSKAGFEIWGNLPGVCDVRGTLKDVIILGRKLKNL